MNPIVDTARGVVLGILLLASFTPRAQPLTHQPTGIVLPEAIAGFSRTNHQDYEARSPGLGAGYNYNNGKGAVATVYLYTAGLPHVPPDVDTPVMTRMRQQTLREIVEFAKSRNEITEHLTQHRLTVKTEGREVPVLFDALTITGPAGARDTLLWLWGSRGHFIKIRATRLPQGELPQTQMDAFRDAIVRAAAD